MTPEPLIVAETTHVKLYLVRYQEPADATGTGRCADRSLTKGEKTVRTATDKNTSDGVVEKSVNFRGRPVSIECDERGEGHETPLTMHHRPFTLCL